jgi:hypothetical protein
VARTRTGSPPPSPPTPPANDPARAMEALGQRLAELTGALSKNVSTLGTQQARRDPGSAVEKQITGSMSLLLGKLTLALTPLALVAAAVGSNTSGFQTFMSAVNLLGATLGTLLLPAFLILAALVYAVSGYIADKLLPGLGDFYAKMVKGALKAAQLIEAAFTYMATKVKAFADWLEKNTTPEQRRIAEATWRSGGAGTVEMLKILQEQEAREKGLPPPARGQRPETEFDRILRKIEERDRLGQPAPGASAALGGVAGAVAAGAGEKSFTSRLVEGLKAAIQDFQLKNAPPVQALSLADAYRQAQLAALKTMSPFEQEQLQLTQKVIDAVNGLGKVIAEKVKPAVGWPN